MAKLSLLLGLLATVSNFTPPTTTDPAAMDRELLVTQEELRFVELVNAERADMGLSELVIDPMLVEIARKHSQEMGDKHYFSHTSPTPGLSTPMQRYLAGEKHRPSWALVGENLFYCSIVDVERGHTALMNSDTHRANILEPRYERIGVGACVTPSGEFYVTQSFLAKRE